MTPIAVNVHRRDETLDLQADLARVRMLANLLDAQFEVGGFRFGLDPIVGLVPVVGDTLSLIAGLYPLYVARKHRLGRSVELRMIANLAADYFGGLLPVVGDLFDASFKANLKNAAILEQAARRK